MYIFGDFASGRLFHGRLCRSKRFLLCICESGVDAALLELPRRFAHRVCRLLPQLPTAVLVLALCRLFKCGKRLVLRFHGGHARLVVLRLATFIRILLRERAPRRFVTLLASLHSLLAGLFTRGKLCLCCRQCLTLPWKRLPERLFHRIGIIVPQSCLALRVLDLFCRLCLLQQVFRARLRCSGVAHKRLARPLVAVRARLLQLASGVLLGVDGLAKRIVAPTGKFIFILIASLRLANVAAVLVRRNVQLAFEFVHQFRRLRHLPPRNVHVAVLRPAFEFARLVRRLLLQAFPGIELARVDRLFAQDRLGLPRKGVLPGRKVLRLLVVLELLHAVAYGLAHLLQCFQRIAHLGQRRLQRVGAAFGRVKLRGLELGQHRVDLLLTHGLEHVGNRLETPVFPEMPFKLVDALARFGCLMYRALYVLVGPFAHLLLAADLVFRLRRRMPRVVQAPTGLVQQFARGLRRLGKTLLADACGPCLELHDYRHRRRRMGPATLGGKAVAHHDVEGDRAHSV